MKPIAYDGKPTHVHPCSKVIGTFLRGLLHLLWKISRVFVIASRLCEHSNIVRFEKRAAETLQHGHIYGDSLMLYGMINTYQWFPCYDWNELCFSNKSIDFSSMYCFLAYLRYLNIKHEWAFNPSPVMLMCNELYRWIGPGTTDLFPDSCGDVFYDVPPTHVDKFVLSHSGCSYLSQLICQLKSLFFELTFDNYIYHMHKRNITNFCLLIPKHIVIQLV